MQSLTLDTNGGAVIAGISCWKQAKVKLALVDGYLYGKTVSDLEPLTPQVSRSKATADLSPRVRFFEIGLGLKTAGS